MAQRRTRLMVRRLMEMEVPLADLIDRTITARTRSGKSWDATTTEVVERSRERIVVRPEDLVNEC